MPEELNKSKSNGTLAQKRQEIYQHLQQSIEQCCSNYSGKKELATETDDTILDLCEALEDAFCYGLRVQCQVTAASIFQNMQEIVTGASIGSTINEESFWDFCQLHLTTDECERFTKLKQLCNKCGRGRAFIRATLNENSLKRYVCNWLNDKKILKRFYTPWSLLLNDDIAQELPKLLESLEQVLFALNIDNAELNSRTRLAKLNTVKPLAREEPLIYAPTPAPAAHKNGTKRRVNAVERPIASSSSVEDLWAKLQQTTLKPTQSNQNSQTVQANEEQPTLPTFHMDAKQPVDPIEPELEFLKTPLPTCSTIEIQQIVAAANTEEYGSDDTSSQYSKSSSANCYTVSNSASPSVSSQQLADTEERLQQMTEHCALLETRVAQLSRENKHLISRLKQVFEATGIDPSCTVAGYNFLITIPRVQLLKSGRTTGTLSSYYVYEIHLTMRHSHEHWKLLRRYRDFHKLHQSLMRTHPSVTKIDFPPKKHFGNMNRVFVEERRAQLEIYLLNLIESLPQVEACKTKSELQRIFPFFREK